MVSERIRQGVEKLRSYVKEENLGDADSIVHYFLGIADGLEVTQRTAKIPATSYTASLRQSPYLYGQVREEIRKRIERGVYKPGQQIPTETALQNEFRVSRPVVRQALMNLKSEGLIYTEKGKGAFVGPKSSESQI